MISNIRHWLKLVETEQNSAGVQEQAAPTIADASHGKKGINRKTADRILDPKGYFHPKWPSQAK